MRTALILICMLIIIASIAAEDMVIINSVDGRDVLSGVFYANAKGISSHFLTASGGGLDTLVAKAGANHSILLIQSKDQPVSSFAQTELAKNGNRIEVYTSTDGGQTNLDLAGRAGASAYVVVDTAYSDGALSALPFAAQKRAYVIMADRNNIDSVKQILSGKTVYIYGQVDDAVITSLAADNPSRIGSGADKFSDNVDIVRMQMDAQNGPSTVLATDGTMLEDSMLNGSMPILLVGRVMPANTYGFVRDEVEAGRLKSVLIVDNALMYPMYDLRERVKAELTASGAANNQFVLRVKFAQTVAGSSGSVLGLDTFSLPAYKPIVNISEVNYDANAHQIMVSVSDTGDGSAYYALEARISVDGQPLKTIGSNQTLLIERGQTAGQKFDLDLSGVMEGNVTALVTVRFGSTGGALEDFAVWQGSLATINYSDDSDLKIAGARYDAAAHSVRISLGNPGSVRTYALARLNLSMGGKATTLTGAQGQSIEPGSVIVQEIPLELNATDLAANANATLIVEYGARAGFLGKSAARNVDLRAPAENGGGISPVMLAAMGVVAFILLVAVWALFLRKKKPRV